MKNLLLVLIGFLIVCTLFEAPGRFLDSFRRTPQQNLGGKITAAAAGSILQLTDAVSDVASEQADLPARLQEAAVSLEAEARRGLIESQYRLSLLYRDANLFEQAYAWATVAAHNGSQAAGDLIGNLEQKMDPRQLGRARNLAGTLQSRK